MSELANQQLLIQSVAYFAICFGTQALLCGISWIIQACRTSSHYRYDSADFIDEEDQEPGK